MTTLMMQTLQQRLAQVAVLPQHVVRTLPAGKVVAYWEMASIGMPHVSAQKVTFTVDGTVAAVVSIPVAEALAAAKSAAGLLLQGEAEAGVYFATAAGDIALVAKKALCRSEDCHCG